MRSSCWMLGLLILLPVVRGIITTGAKTSTEVKVPEVAAQTVTSDHQDSVSGRQKILSYSEWSTWTECDLECERTRERRCLDPGKCGNIVLKETDLCPHHGDRRNRRKCQRAQNRRKHRHKSNEFHVVRIPLHAPRAQNTPKPKTSHVKPQMTQKNRKSKTFEAINKQKNISQNATKPKSFHVVRIASSLRNSTEKKRSKAVNSKTSGSKSSKPRIPAKASRRNRPGYPSTYHTAYDQWARVAGRYYQTTPYPFVYPSGYFGWGNHVNSASRPRESAVIFPNSGVPSIGKRPSAERLTVYESKLYGKWSRWSQCSRSCTTRRRRMCKRRDLCGNTMLKESAYCYVEDSYCQRWIRRKMQNKDENNEAIQELPYPEYESGRANKGEAFYSRHTGNVDDESAGECGVAGNATKSLGNLLRIIGGRPTAKGRWPWQVAVLNRYREAFCGGTLVSSRWVLTAAHCTRKRLYVRVGEHDLSETDGSETELRIDQMIRHPNYDEETVDNDVALLHLPEHVDGVLACLPRPRQPLPTDRYCTIIGWGKRVSSDTFGTDVLHEAEVPIVASDICRHVYEDYYITGNMFCAGYRRGRMDSCAGDSGGPLLCMEGNRWTIFGITSFGEGCGKHGKYGIYTRLPNYVKWIQKIIND